ncbi:MAG: BamA/TamA family outer membrane protein [Bacteroidetes bacterium]|nr:BamA/TamA family outer membrane protein [Bacteroidota bacterium]
MPSNLFGIALTGVLLAFGLLVSPDVRAQTAPDSDSLLVWEVGFAGNSFFSADDLSLYIRTRRNRRMIGVPGFTWWRWLYKFGEGSLGANRVGRVFMAAGEPPALLDRTLLENDVEQLRLFYQREGFRDATIEASVNRLEFGDRIRVEFEVQEGNPTHIRHFRYNGLDDLTDREKRELRSQSLIPLGTAIDGDQLAWRVETLRYSEPLLVEERQRLIGYLRNEGFADVNRNAIHAVVYPVSPDSFDVTIDVALGTRFRFGDVDFQVAGPIEGATVRRDSTYLSSSEQEQPGGTVSASFIDEPRLDFDLLRRTLQFRPGDQFNQSRLLATKRRIDATGVFSFSDIETATPDSTRPDAIRLDHSINLQTRARHQIRFETFMLQRSGALADTDNELGTGLGVTYSNLNLFGGGEAFTIRSTGTVAADIGGLGGFTSAQWESSATLSYPYLTFPFGRFDRLSSLYDARSQISVSLLAARRDALKLTLRGRGGARYRFELRHTESLSSVVDLVDITVSNPDTLEGFKSIFLDDVLTAVDDPVQQAQIIEDYTRPQFNNALRYTIRSTTTDLFRRENGHFREASIEFGGNMGRVLDGLVFSPSEVEGTIPGFGVFGGSGTNRGMIYRQYVRLSVDMRRYKPLTSRSVLAWKLMTGIAHPTGASDVVPFDRRFYSGGANSIRAWRLRELGPGSARFTSDADSLVVSSDGSNILGGDIKLEGSIELRTIAIRRLFEANWILTLFADAGNVWLGPRNPGTSDGRFRFDSFSGDLGVGAGYGLRIAWEYIIVRLDVGYKVFDPRRRGEFMPDRFSDPVLQFGIGHTF